MANTPNAASRHTAARNAPVELGFDDADFDRAGRGLVARHATGKIGHAWDINRYDFIERGTPNPDTVDPSLWRQAQLNNIHGLFQVAPKMWQARGYDISNVTFIEGDTGWVVIDPLTVTETAEACLELANSQLGERPVVAVIYTHSHTDHFGGVLGVTTPEDVAAGRCRIIAPEHFMRETIGENVIAGYAMARRAAYQFGPFLPPGPRGHVDCGLGKAIPFSTPGLLAPTEDITFTGEELDIDGVRIVFQMTPEAEAPAEMNFFFPDHGWLCMAENCTHNMHNLVPIRGANVRDARKWSVYIDEAMELFGDRTELMFASHHWPRWGSEDVLHYLTLQRDLYRWMHDQTMRHANTGLVPTEIAEAMELPPEFRAESHTVGYYGSLIHNVKAVYQRYLSWYDGNPTHLHALPPCDVGARYVELAGGADALLEHARQKYDEGDYRWVAELVNHLVFADPENVAARELQADTLEQLGYQSESATFRNAYLTGAQELRNGPLFPPRPANRLGYLDAMSVDQIIDMMGVRLISEDVGGLSATLNLTFSDAVDGEHVWVIRLSNRVLGWVKGRHDESADAHLTLTKPALAALSALETTIDDAVAAGDISIDGDAAAAGHVFDHLDVFMSSFGLIEP
jgi:alkyl sulfatase BDS1-like metallo-beta-lactamase superfamily hydrolase